MSEAPYQSPPSAASTAAPAPSNMLGIFGFIVSLLAIIAAAVTCGIGSVLSPIGLLISLIGLFKAPRGFAIAGTILGVIGSGVLVAVSGSIIALVMGGSAAFQAIQTGVAIGQAHMKVQEYRNENGEFPDAIEGNKLILDLKDGWKNSLRYEYEDGSATFTVRSAGPDGKFDTPDDITTPGDPHSVDPPDVEFGLPGMPGEEEERAVPAPAPTEGDTLPAPELPEDPEP